MRRAFSITVLSALAGLAQAQDTNPFDCSNFLQFGGNLDKTRAAFVQSPDTLAWNWFACLNQPASAQSPDRVWETLKPSAQLKFRKRSSMRCSRLSVRPHWSVPSTSLSKYSAVNVFCQGLTSTKRAGVGALLPNGLPSNWKLWLISGSWLTYPPVGNSPPVTTDWIWL